MLLGIMGAMPEETEMIFAAMTDKEIVERGSRLYYRGKLSGQEVVAVFSRWGKVAAATTAVHLILDFKVDQIVFTGVAGGISPELNIGDIVVGERLFQHDMDARPLMNRFEIPLTGKTSYEISQPRVDMMKEAVHRFLVNNKSFRKELSDNNIVAPKLVAGDIASGDLFISNSQMKAALSRNIPSVVCAEMEGAAVAQVCDDYEIPFVIVRVISDAADEQAHLNATRFVLDHAAGYSLNILNEYIQLLHSQ